MSLFDAIKYPVTIRFEEDILDSIPTHLLEAWWADCCSWRTQSSWNRRAIPPVADRIHAYLNHSTPMQDRVKILARLKEVILALP